MGGVRRPKRQLARDRALRVRRQSSRNPDRNCISRRGRGRSSSRFLLRCSGPAFTLGEMSSDDLRKKSLARRATAEALGTCFLLAMVIGSGIMGERLASGNVAIALLANTLSTGAGLVALILTFGPISGAHFNPAVNLADASQGWLSWRDVPVYFAAQVAGAFAGVAIAHVMFKEPALF